ncbi:MAG TPA: diguanylate cyclase [Candidatus Ozemobacteraceae bacterium]|nr:diguanylate cyclase [Candidatus Ozemobacteraceae bacterium]
MTEPSAPSSTPAIVYIPEASGPLPAVQSPLIGWMVLYVFFFALPIAALYFGYRDYISRQHLEEIGKTSNFFTCELSSLRTRASNTKVLTHLCNMLGGDIRPVIDNPKKLRNVIADFQEQIPATATILVWDTRGNLLFPTATEAGVLADLPRFFQIGNTSLAGEISLQPAASTERFEKEYADEISRLSTVLGSGFPFAKSVTLPGKIIISSDVLHPCIAYWQFFPDTTSGKMGYAVILAKQQLPETFGLSWQLRNNRNANPELTSGFIDLEQNIIDVSYRELEKHAAAFLNEYRQTLVSPVIRGDWVLTVMPLGETSPVRLFNLFSLRRLRQQFEDRDFEAQVIIGTLLLLGALYFGHSYRQRTREGLSIRFRLVGITLLSMFLPIAFLGAVALHFTLDRSKILAGNTQEMLLQEVKHMDEGIVEFFRAKMAWLRSLKNTLPELATVDVPALTKRFLELQKAGQLERVYLVAPDGSLLYDQDHLFQEFGRKAFISELGRKTIEYASLKSLTGLSDANARDSIGKDFINNLASGRGVLHKILWPGSAEQVYLFVDVFTPSPQAALKGTGPLAVIITINKTGIEEEYVRKAIATPKRRGSEVSFFAVRRDGSFNTIPELRGAFKANLLPLLDAAQALETPQPERVTVDDRHLLLTIRAGMQLDEYYLGAYTDWDVVMGSIEWFERLSLSTILLSISASLSLVFFLVRSFLTPIRVLSEGTRAISGGDLTRHLPIYDRDELGHLSQAFNEMTRRLNNRLNELTLLYNLAQKASTTHSQREIFELVAQRMREYLAADSCGTAWINEGEGKMNLYLGESPDAEIAERARQATITAITNRALHVETIGEGAILGIPLLFEEKEFGGIYLVYTRTIPNITPEIRSFIEMVQRQLSLIIENQRLFEQAVTDGLTKLYVRRFFLANLEKELARARRYHLDMSLVMIDIDHFKKFNDNYGHQTGDMVLRETAQRILETIRSTDTPGRYGGEEMAVILPQTGLKDAAMVAERMRVAVEEANYIDKDRTLKVTISVGVTSLLGRQLTMEEMIEECDQCLYKAKDLGRNRVVIAEAKPASLEVIPCD